MTPLNTTATQIIEEIKSLLGDRINKSGVAFYSSIDTVKKGRYMILGLNPGGNPEVEKGTIGQSLEGFLSPVYNHYYEAWKEKDTRLQINIAKLFAFLGQDLRNVCALNLIFERTVRESDLNFSSLPVYVKVLNKVLDVVQPDVIFTFGKKPLFEVKRVMTNINVEVIGSGHGSWKIEFVTGQLNDRTVRVIGFPHLSIYTLYNRPEKLEAVRIFAANRL